MIMNRLLFGKSIPVVKIYLESKSTIVLHMFMNTPPEKFYENL